MTGSGSPTPGVRADPGRPHRPGPNPGLAGGLLPHLHAHPELSHQEHGTAAQVAKRLRGYGQEVHEGIGGTGVIGLLRTGDGPATHDLTSHLPLQEHVPLQEGVHEVRSGGSAADAAGTREGPRARVARVSTPRG
ncbi:MAG TPA: hypothetical protein VI248_08300 [Kineosporiaceae bacterium]